MAATPSNMLPLGTTAPDFTLPDTVSDQTLSLQTLKSDKATLVMFICNHCPYVIHVADELVKLSQDYTPQGVSLVAISANDVDNYPADAPDKMKALANTWGNPFPYLYDESQATAKAYKAACTPDFYLFDGELKCAYRGQLDGSRPGNNTPVTGKDLRAALDNLLAGKPVDPNQTPSIGCNIKWK
ncbi:MAG: thioredoxin family protein [Pseudomonadota bacterium]